MHTTEEADDHDAVTQLVKLTRLDGVTSRDPKLIPDTVTLHPAVATPFSSATKLTEGAANAVSMTAISRDKRKERRSSWTKCNRPLFSYRRMKACVTKSH